MKTYGLVRIAKEITYNNGVAKFSVAHNDYKKEAHFFNCVAFKGTAEVLFNNCKVGDRIFIDGDNLNNNYKNKDDIMIYQNQVVIRSFEFIEKKEQDSGHADMYPQKNNRQQKYDSVNVAEDDLPF